MENVRTTLEMINNSLLALRHEVNDLKVEHTKLIESSKVERSDILYTADELKKVKFSNGIGDRKLQKMIEEGMPQTILYEGAHPKYSDKAVDAWIASRQIRSD